VKNKKQLFLESNTSSLIRYKSHLSKKSGFIDSSQLNGSLRVIDSTKTRGIYELYHIEDLCIATISDQHGCKFCEYFHPVESVRLICFEAFSFKLPVLLFS
jgi:hypothetical protein